MRALFAFVRRLISETLAEQIESGARVLAALAVLIFAVSYCSAVRRDATHESDQNARIIQLERCHEVEICPGDQ